MSNICVKAHFEDGIDYPLYLTASLTTETLNNLSLEMNALEEDILTLVLLSNIFNISTNSVIGSRSALAEGAHLYDVDFNSVSSLIVGYLEDASINPNHDSESLSLVTYTLESFKEATKIQVPFTFSGTYEDWVAALDAVELEDLIPHLIDLGAIPNNTLAKDFPRKLVISRPSASDLMNLNSSLGSNYEDFFDTFKAKVSSTNTSAGTSNGTPFVVSGDNSVDVSVPFTLELLELMIGGGGFENAG